MPQFDTITFFNQIFWLILLFLYFYFLVLKILMPLLVSALKTRKKIINTKSTGLHSATTDQSTKIYLPSISAVLGNSRLLSLRSLSDNHK